MTLLSTLMNVADQVIKNKANNCNNSAVPRRRKRKVRKAIPKQQGTGWSGLQQAFSQPTYKQQIFSEERKIQRFERRTERLQKSNQLREDRQEQTRKRLKDLGF